MESTNRRLHVPGDLVEIKFDEVAVYTIEACCSSQPGYEHIVLLHKGDVLLFVNYMQKTCATHSCVYSAAVFLSPQFGIVWDYAPRRRTDGR